MSKFLYQWRNLVQHSFLAPTTRLVLFNLYFYMQLRDDDKAFPSTAQQALDTGLSERSVCTHLELAEKAGFITKNRAGFKGKGWSHLEYKAAIPIVQGTEGGSVRNTLMALKEVQCQNTEGTEPHDNMALKEVQSNTKRGIIKEREERESARATPLFVFFDDLGIEHIQQKLDERDAVERPLSIVVNETYVERFKTHYRSVNKQDEKWNWPEKLWKWILEDDERGPSRGHTLPDPEETTEEILRKFYPGEYVQ